MAVASLSRFHLPTLAHLTSLHRLSLRPLIHTPPKPFSTLILAPRPSPTLPRAHVQETLAGPAAKPPDSAARDGGGEEEIVEIPIDRLFVPPETEVSLDVRARVLKGSNIVLSKYARDSRVLQAEYVKSSVATEDCPGDGLPEFALVGRSNVGKSSLLNSLVRRKKLALTSKTPGKTQCINHFRINDSWYIVDLPGYGYASAPLEVKKDWVKFTKDYFLNRSTLVSVFLLIDATIPAKKIDLDYASWLGQNKSKGTLDFMDKYEWLSRVTVLKLTTGSYNFSRHIPMTLVFTKCDKRKKKRKGGRKPQENVLAFQELIRESFEAAPPWIMTSSVTNQGRDEILLHMAQLRNYWLKH